MRLNRQLPQWIALMALAVAASGTAFAQKKEVARVMPPNDIPADKVDPGPFNGSP